MLQDKFKNSEVFVSSVLQSELLASYFNDFNDRQEPGLYKFKAQIKPLPKNRCIRIMENQESFFEDHCLAWRQVVFQIAYSLNELKWMTEEKPNYQVDIQLRKRLINLVENILGYAQVEYPMGCYIKIIFPDTGLCSLYDNENTKQTYLQGKVGVTLSLIDFDVA
jgi:hypothetical protein